MRKKKNAEVCNNFVNFELIVGNLISKFVYKSSKTDRGQPHLEICL